MNVALSVLELPELEPELETVPCVLACPACDQEMRTESPELPLHMNHRGELCVGSGTEGAAPRGGDVIREPLTRVDLDKLTLAEVLHADTCLACGGVKASGNTICPGCFNKLPTWMQAGFPERINRYLFLDAAANDEFMKSLRAVLERLDPTTKQEAAE